MPTSNILLITLDRYGDENSQSTGKKTTGSMATFDSSSSSGEDPKLDLIKKIRSHEVAIAELTHLPSSRAVYQKTGNIFYLTTIQKATSSEQKQLDSDKAKLEKLNSS